MAESYILMLAEARDAARVGGKAINLGALIRAGFAVPGGFVVTTEAFRAGREGKLAEVEAAIREAYRGLGGTVAVRSSATAEDMAGASMAGQYETILDVNGEEAVVAAVKKCWGSLSSARTAAYLREHGIDQSQVAMAVVVQRLVAAEISGVMFTANPHTGEEGEILIEASYGLGEAIVSGEVQPDTVIVERGSGHVKTYQVGSKEIAIEAGTHEKRAVSESQRAARCLGEGEVAKLRELAERVQKHFSAAQDTEWAMARGELYLLQSRAITTLEAAKLRAGVLRETKAALKAALTGAAGEGWARHNLGETLPQPTPLTWSVVGRFMTPAGGFGAMYRIAGYEPSAKLGAEGFLRLVGGRVYMDLACSAEMFFAGFPFHYDLELLRAKPSAAQDAPTVQSGSLVQQFRTGRRLKRAAKRLAALAENFDRQLDVEIVPAFRQWIAEEGARDLSRLSADEWLERWRQRERRVMDEFAPQSLLPSLICGMALENLRAFLAPHMWEGTDDPEELANLLAAAGPANATMRSNDALYQVAAGHMAIETWLQENGHRAPDEFDLASPRWRERPEAVTALAQHLLGGKRPGDEHHGRREEAERRIAALKQSLTAREKRELDEHVSLAQRYLRFREDGKHELMRGYELLRQMVLNAAGRLQIAADDVCLMTLDELSAALRTGTAPRELLDKRRQLRQAEAKIALPDVIGPGDVDSLGELSAAHLPHDADRLPAFPISSGSAKGPARIVASPETAGDLGRDYILVCRSTDPSWTPLFVNAAGLILECGGSLSHGAVVAREMAKPAVVLPNATQLVRENQAIAIDGTGGAVYLQGTASSVMTSEKQDPNDVRVAFDQIPPAPGRREKSAAVLRNVALIFWAIFLGLVFLVPQTHLRESSTAFLDSLLWPSVRHVGPQVTVTLIAAMLALASMIGQRYLTDTPRLREAKRRAAKLRKGALALPENSPRRNVLLAHAAPVQTRLTLAAFVPLAVLLGPMVLSFLWLPERIDPAVQNPRPGSTAIVSVTLDGDYAGTVKLEPDSKLARDGLDPKNFTLTLTPMRAALETLRAQLQSGAPLPVAVQSLHQSREQLLADLEKFLASPMPPQTVTWTLPTPPDSKVYMNAVAAGGAPVPFTMTVGNAAPPPKFENDEKGNRYQLIDGAGPIKAVRLRYADPTRAEARAFFAPLSPLGIRYDFGWLGIYLLVYVAVLFPVRWALGIP